MTDGRNVFLGMLDTIEQNASESIKANEGDYEIDGLLYCVKCHTPKQCRVNIFGVERKPYCLCKCEIEKRDAEEAERKRQEFEIKIAKFRKAGFPESKMQSWTFANDDGGNSHVTKIALNYVENFAEMRKRGKGLLLYGEVGVGKSYYAACIVNALIDRGYPCLMTDFPRLEKTISGMYDGKQEYIDGLNRFPLLVIDDLARERDTDYMSEIVQDVVNNRYLAGLPTIITTNLTAEEIKNPVDIRKQRTYSRLLEMCVPVEVTGKDRRRKQLKEDYDELKDILGL